MNPLNYASLEASKRLVDAGIVLETDVTWGCQVHGGSKVWKLQPADCHFVNDEPEYPAPSMAEVWRELPRYIEIKGYHYELLLTKEPDGFSCVHYSDLQRNYTIFRSDNTNPTDALIDLLIWVRKEKL